MTQAVEDWLSSKGVPVVHLNGRQRFLCLRSLYPDEKAARSIHLVWEMLSGACHGGTYELVPNDADLRVWLRTVETFVEVSVD